VAMPVPGIGPSTNPLQPRQAAQASPTAGMPSLSSMIAMSLLQKLVPPTHTLQPIPHNPFAEVPKFAAGEFPAAQLHVMPAGAGTRLPEMPMAGERMPDIRPPGRIGIPSQMPGRRLDARNFMRPVLGDTGETSYPPRLGEESQYG
jgi:hypothetical protein